MTGKATEKLIVDGRCATPSANATNNTSACITRRVFLQQAQSRTFSAAAACAGASLLPMIFSACGSARYAASTVEGTRIVIELAQFSATDSVLVEAPGGELPIHVRRQPDGSFAALSTRCMHRGCQVDPAGDRFICPCHGSEYSMEGNVLKGPTEKPLVRFRTSVDDLRVYVHLDAAFVPGET